MNSLTLVLTLLLLGCTASKKTETSNETKASGAPPGALATSDKSSPAIPLVTPSGVLIPSSRTYPVLGAARLPRASADQRRVLYLSGLRKEHKQFQIYELDLASGWSRRVTFQDGDIGSLGEIQNGQAFLFSSTTDEIKEHMDLRHFVQGKSREDSEPLPKSEIYWAQKDGSHIRRLTRKKGFDGEVATSLTGLRFFYLSESPTGLTLQEAPVGGGPSRSVSHFPPGLRRPAWSHATQKLAGTIPAESNNLVIVQKLGSRPDTLSLPPADWSSPAWSPDGKSLLVSAHWPDTSNAEIYRIDLEKSCLQRMTYLTGEDRDPSFHPSGKQILWIHHAPTGNEIHVRDSLDSAPCESYGP